ncbi:hypothetical protein [Myxosarcina sp. GI1(2024)]
MLVTFQVPAIHSGYSKSPLAICREGVYATSQGIFLDGLLRLKRSRFDRNSAELKLEDKDDITLAIEQ